MILLDTQVLAWLVRRPERLSRPARRVIERASRSAGLAIASVTLMELAQMTVRGEVRIQGTPGTWLREIIAESGAGENEDYFLNSARWRWSFTAELRRVSGTFLFMVSLLRSTPLIMGRR